MLYTDSHYFQENIVIQSPQILWELFIKVNLFYKLDGYPQGRNDQLAMILSTIGKPTE
jgi:hypothetical protein